MNSMKYLMTAIGCVGLAIGGTTAMADEQPVVGAEKSAAVQSVYVCPDCHTLAVKDGNCAKCGKAMSARHVLGVSNGEAMLCGCGPTCKCDAAGMKDGKCACGKEVVKMSVKGMYVCKDGCPQISDKPGKCACGKELMEVK